VALVCASHFLLGMTVSPSFSSHFTLLFIRLS
jgi:hypothetical protein